MLFYKHVFVFALDYLMFSRHFVLKKPQDIIQFAIADFQRQNPALVLILITLVESNIPLTF